MITYTYTTQLSGGNQLYQINTQVSAGAKASIHEPVPDGATDLDISFAFPNAAASDSAKALGLLSDTDLTVKVCQSDNTVLDTINLTAGEPYIWAEGLTDPTWRNAGDVAKLRATNSSGSATNLKADVLFDPTV